jgi:hypothetical protein
MIAVCFLATSLRFRVLLPRKALSEQRTRPRILDRETRRKKPEPAAVLEPPGMKDGRHTNNRKTRDPEKGERRKHGCNRASKKETTTNDRCAFIRRHRPLWPAAKRVELTAAAWLEYCRAR